jgi:Cytochrome c554 and c-prime
VQRVTLKTPHRPWRCLLLVALLVVGALLWHFGREQAAARSYADDSGPASGAEGKWCGVGSCAAAACHGGGGPGGSAGSEYTTWIRNDPHSRAYSVLLEDRSRRMVRGLKDARPATEYPLCLGCHVRNDREAGQTPAALRQDGVGCENCHGPAGNWLGLHYLDDWKQKTPEQKHALGMTDTSDLRQRAEACAACHVGTPGHEVNHDLIAAGHPRLNFEFAAYLDLMPRHWDAAAEKKRIPDLELRAWTIGQLASARAALLLLADRAQRAPEHPGNWPEFAEYDCYACHHSLRTSNWQEKEGYAGRKPGSLPWGSWYFSLLPQAVGRSDIAGIDKLRQLMEEPRPDPRAVAREAQGRADEIGQWLNTIAGGRLPQTSLSALAKAPPSGDLNWDRATQAYCALAAYYVSWQDRHAGERDLALEGRLRDLMALLRFPRATAGKALPTSPADYDREKFLKQLQDLPLNR